MNQQYRIRDFTRRQVRDRERLYNPEVSDWPEDNDRGANWDYLIYVIGGFVMALAVIFLGVVGFVFYQVIGWP